MTTEQLEEALHGELYSHPEGYIADLLRIILMPEAPPLAGRLLALIDHPTRRLSLACHRGHLLDGGRICTSCERTRREARPRTPRAKPKVPDTTDGELDWVAVDRILRDPDMKVERRDKPATARALHARGWTKNRIGRRLHLSGTSVLRALGDR